MHLQAFRNPRYAFFDEHPTTAHIHHRTSARKTGKHKCRPISNVFLNPSNHAEQRLKKGRKQENRKNIHHTQLHAENDDLSANRSTSVASCNPAHQVTTSPQVQSTNHRSIRTRHKTNGPTPGNSKSPGKLTSRGFFTRSMVGERGFEPPTSASRTLLAAGLRHSPLTAREYHGSRVLRKGKPTPLHIMLSAR